MINWYALTDLDRDYERAVAETYPTVAAVERERYGPPLDYLGRTPADRKRERRRKWRERLRGRAS